MGGQSFAGARRQHVEAVQPRATEAHQELEAEIFGLGSDAAAQRSGNLAAALEKGGLRAYLVRVHGIAAASAQAGGADLRHYADAKSLAGAKGQGWTTGRDRYGAVTIVKLEAGVARDVTLR